MGPGAPACEALVCTPTSCNTAATEAESSQSDSQFRARFSLLQMNKWLALLTASQVAIATATGVTPAMIGTQAMLVQQGEIEHP